MDFNYIKINKLLLSFLLKKYLHLLIFIFMRKYYEDG